MAQVLDVINGALLDIGARAAGDVAPPEDVNEAFTILNWMLDQWSNESMMLFCKQEIIHELTAGTYIYTIGSGGDVGCTITGSITGSVLTVTGTTGALSQGMTLAGTGITAGTAITSYGTGRGGIGAQPLGTYNLNLSYVAPVAGPFTASAVRPLKINSAFVRIVNSISGTLDYPVGILNLEKYELIGIKTLPGPWPRGLYYQPSEPLGILYYWPNPSQGEMHLFCDTVLNNFVTVNDTIAMPQGVLMALRNNLSLYLMPSYGKVNQIQVEMITKMAMHGRSLIKRTNMAPAQTANFDAILIPGRINDAGFILNGGFA